MINKKILALFLAIPMALSFAACSNSSSDTKESSVASREESIVTITKNSKFNKESSAYFCDEDTKSALAVDKGTFSFMSADSGYKHSGTIDSDGNFYCTSDSEKDVIYTTGDNTITVRADGKTYELKPVSVERYTAFVQPINNDVTYHKDSDGQDESSEPSAETSRQTSENSKQEQSSQSSTGTTESSVSQTSQIQTSNTESSVADIDVPGVPRGQSTYYVGSGGSGRGDPSTLIPVDVDEPDSNADTTVGHFIDEENGYYTLDIDHSDKKVKFTLKVSSDSPLMGSYIDSTFYFGEVDETYFDELPKYEYPYTVVLKTSGGSDAKTLKINWKIDTSNVDIRRGADMSLRFIKGQKMTTVHLVDIPW